jgi:hypothetical protein
MAKRGVLEHPKTLDLACTLGIMDCFALGILEAFWHHVGKYHEDGDMTGAKPAMVARSIRYTGDAQELWDALIDAGFLDVLPDGRTLVHGWSEHADDAVHTRLYRSVTPFADGVKPKARSIGIAEKSRLDVLWTENGRPANVLPEPEPEPEPEPDEEKKEMGAGGLAPRALIVPMTVDVHQEMLNLGVDKAVAAEQAEIYVNRRKATGWKIGATQIVDWKADLKSWIQNPNFAKAPPEKSGAPPREEPLAANEHEVLDANPELTTAVRDCLSTWQASGLKAVRTSERTVYGYVKQLFAKGITAEILTKYEPRVLSGAKFAPSVYELISLLEPHLSAKAVVVAAENEPDDEETKARNVERYGTETPTIKQIQAYTHGRLHIQSDDREEVGAA